MHLLNFSRIILIFSLKYSLLNEFIAHLCFIWPPGTCTGATLYVNNPGLLEPDSFIRLSVLSYKHKVKVWNCGLNFEFFLQIMKERSRQISNLLRWIWLEFGCSALLLIQSPKIFTNCKSACAFILFTKNLTFGQNKKIPFSRRRTSRNISRNK